MDMEIKYSYTQWYSDGDSDTDSHAGSCQLRWAKSDKGGKRVGGGRVVGGRGHGVWRSRGGGG